MFKHISSDSDELVELVSNFCKDNWNRQRLLTEVRETKLPRTNLQFSDCITLCIYFWFYASTDKDLNMLPIIIADVDIESTLIAMCKQAEILLNCVGPVWNSVL